MEYVFTIHFNTHAICQYYCHSLIIIFRNNFECLLKDVTELLSDGVERVTKSKLEQYPYFFNMVKSMLHDEINDSKDKIKHHLDIMIDINRRVINTEHPSFDVIGSLKKNRIR